MLACSRAVLQEKRAAASGVQHCEEVGGPIYGSRIADRLDDGLGHKVLSSA